MATMDFFESQERAHKKTALLVLLFALAVVLIIVGVYVVIAGVLLYMSADAGQLATDGGPTFWRPKLMLAVALGTVAVVAAGSLYKIQQLRGGGRIVAESLGGRHVTSDNADPQEKKLLNVVDEMAIAAGIPAPPVFILPQEKGINAFAAGYSPGNAVIGVTRGAVEQLDRDELQGVIAHEFSHILNGDMRMNIRLMGVINGILLIAIVGYLLLYGGGGGYGGFAAHRHLGFSAGRNNRGKIVFIGLGLIAIGAIGMVIGNLMKAAVSRQREYLADASAVQFTRHPDGLAGALKRIAGFTGGTQVGHPNANEVSHMFFGRAIRSGLAGLFSTHPRIERRIRQIDPTWQGEAEEGGGVAPAAAAGASGFAGGGSAAPSEPAGTKTSTEERATAADRVGQPTSDHLQYARELLEQVPERIIDAAGEPYGARAVVYALLLDEKQEVRDHQLDRLAENADYDVYALTQKLFEPIQGLDPKARLPLIDVAIGALREITPAQYDAFEKNVDALIKADQRIDRFEWCLHRMLAHHLRPEFGRAKEPRVRYYALKRLHDPCERLLSTLAYAGHDDAEAAKRAFEKGAEMLNEPNLAMRPKDECGLDALDHAMDQLEQVSMPCKRRLVSGAAACVSADREVTVREAEFFRGICDSLDCPMPPLLPGQPLG